MKKQIEIIDKFVKEFDDSDSWYNTNDYWSKGDHYPPFNTDLELLTKVCDKILSVFPTTHRVRQTIFWAGIDQPKTPEKLIELFEDVVYEIQWWNNWCKRNITRDVKAGIKDGSIKHEDDARAIAYKYLTSTITSYRVTGYISDLLPRTVKRVIIERKYKHPYFKGKMTNTLYEDIWGRVWSKGVGVIKPTTETQTFSFTKYWQIKGLGGSMWKSRRGKTFICEYRTSEDEHTNNTRPETFIG